VQQLDPASRYVLQRFGLKLFDFQPLRRSTTADIHRYSRPAARREEGSLTTVIDTVAAAGFGAPSTANRCAAEPSLPQPYTAH
jgi:hypothetical protein